MHDLRQQLSADSLVLLQQCVALERERLKKLHWDSLAHKPSQSYLASIAAEQRTLDEAERQLQSAFLDQFEAGRKENDGAGRTGLQPAVPA